MKFLLHLIITRHDTHINAGVDQVANVVFEDIRKCFENSLKRKVVKSIKIPTLAEYIKHDCLFLPNVTAPRLWVDISVNVPEFQKNHLSHFFDPQKNDDICTRPLNDFVSCMDDLIAPRILASNICNPGAISCIGGGVLAGNTYLLASPVLANFLLESLELARSIGWPKEIPVTYKQTLKWVESTIEKYYTVSRSRNSRALAAFSHIATHSHPPAASSLDLFWAMMGLEALYCEGADGIKKQLFDKAAVIFGPLQDYKKRIKNLYDVRSELIHGSKDIPYAFSDNYIDDNLDKYFDDISEAESISYLLLVATLQYLAKCNCSELNFSYSLKK